MDSMVGPAGWWMVLGAVVLGFLVYLYFRFGNRIKVSPRIDSLIGVCMLVASLAVLLLSILGVNLLYADYCGNQATEFVSTTYNIPETEIQLGNADCTKRLCGISPFCTEWNFMYYIRGEFYGRVESGLFTNHLYPAGTY